MEERFRFIEEWNSGEFSLAELCRFYGISRGTGYKWIGRYEAVGLEGLRDLSRAPHHHPNEISQEIEEQVIAVRADHPSWGAPKIHSKLQSVLGAEKVPAESTIGAILKRNGLTVNRKRRRNSRRASEPLAHAGESNAVWCADYKGWFRTADGTRIEPLTITDAYSRYLLRCQALAQVGYAPSKPVFEAAFREYGLPVRIRTDNGAPFASNGESGLTGLSVWWIKLGITPERIEPGKPQQNGRHERMHRTLKQETASPPAKTRRAQQQRFDEFRSEYNEDRPHEALNQTPPAQHYEPSARAYPERLPDIEYPSNWMIRAVCAAGKMRWKGEHVFVAHALEGERVGLEQIEEQRWRVWFSSYEVGLLDETKQRILRPQRDLRSCP
jgi:transposase InsO family protein